MSVALRMVPTISLCWPLFAFITFCSFVLSVTQQAWLLLPVVLLGYLAAHVVVICFSLFHEALIVNQ